MKALLLLLVCGQVYADARLIGTSSTHLMFNYHGELLFCPRSGDPFRLITCLDANLKYVICRILPAELGYLDCGHKSRAGPGEREAAVFDIRQ